MYAVIQPINGKFPVGTILQYLDEVHEFSWGDLAAFVIMKVTDLRQKHLDAVRNSLVDLSKILTPTEKLNAEVNRQIHDDMYRNIKNSVVQIKDVSCSSQINALLTILETEAMNYSRSGVSLPYDENYASYFRNEIHNQLLQGISHFITRIENEITRIRFETEGVQPDLNKSFSANLIKLPQQMIEP